MNRRDAGSALLALGLAPLTIEAQQPKRYRIGVASVGGGFSAVADGMRDGLKELGLDEGRHFILDVRDTKGDLKAIDEAARNLEDGRVDLIFTVSTSVSLAVLHATRSVPIVFYAGSDPVALGLVESYSKPGGRITGVYDKFTDATAKRLALLKEIIPQLNRVVTFYNPNNPVAQRGVAIARDAARQLNVEMVERAVTSVDELRAGLQALKPGEVDAFFYVLDAMISSQSHMIIEACTARRVPTIFPNRADVDAGALASYGASYYAVGIFSAKQVKRVLLGADPGTLPVEQVDAVQLTINLRTAKSLGLTVPRSVLLRADHVVQ